MVGKAQKAANPAWGVMKRAGRDRRDDRVYLMNSLVRSVALYGVETWGWLDLCAMKKMQGRYAKMYI